MFQRKCTQEEPLFDPTILVYVHRTHVIHFKQILKKTRQTRVSEWVLSTPTPARTHTTRHIIIIIPKGTIWITHKIVRNLASETNLKDFRISITGTTCKECVQQSCDVETNDREQRNGALLNDSVHASQTTEASSAKDKTTRRMNVLRSEKIQVKSEQVVGTLCCERTIAELKAERCTFELAFAENWDLGLVAYGFKMDTFIVLEK